MKTMTFMCTILLGCSFSIAEIHTKQKTQRTGRKLDLGLTQKTPATFDEVRESNDGYKRIDMSQFKEFETTSKTKAAAKMVCKSRSGVTYRQNQTGYDDCVRQAGYESSSQHRPSDPNSASVGTEVEFEN